LWLFFDLQLTDYVIPSLLCATLFLVLILLMLACGGDVLCGMQIAADMNDARLIMNKLSLCNTDCDIMQVFSSIQGPWAFVFWQVGRVTFINFVLFCIPVRLS